MINFSSAISGATKNQKKVEFEFEGKFSDLLIELTSLYGETFEKRLISENSVKRFVNVYINGKDFRYLNHELTNIRDSDTVDFIPSVSGG